MHYQTAAVPLLRHVTFLHSVVLRALDFPLMGLVNDRVKLTSTRLSLQIFGLKLEYRTYSGIVNTACKDVTIVV
jgi:hypothetical protein